MNARTLHQRKTIHQRLGKRVLVRTTSGNAAVRYIRRFGGSIGKKTLAGAPMRVVEFSTLLTSHGTEVFINDCEDASQDASYCQSCGALYTADKGAGYTYRVQGEIAYCHKCTPNRSELERQRKMRVRLVDRVSTLPRDREGWRYWTDDENVYSLEYAVSRFGDILAVKVWLATGAPEIWLDTRTAMVYGKWHPYHTQAPVDKEMAAEVRNHYAEIYGL